MTPEIVRQVDLAELAPRDMYIEVHKKMNVVRATSESIFWYHFYSLVGVAQNAQHPLTPGLIHLIKKAHELHYVEASIRLGLVKPIQHGDTKENGILLDSQGNRQESSSSPSTENSTGTGSIILPNEDQSTEST